jgi:hypothetical protein
MRTRSCIALALGLFILIVAPSNARAWDQYELGRRVTFDAQNWIEVAQTTGSLLGGDMFWPVVRLSHAGQEQTITPAREDSGWQHTRRDIYDVVYMDADHVWIWSRLGHRMNQLALFKLPELKCVELYNGSLFRLSPDRERVAWTYPLGKMDHMLAAFVLDQDWLLTPEVRAIPEAMRANGSLDLMEREGALWQSSVREADARLARWSPVWWRNERQLTLIAQAPNEGDPHATPEFTVVDVTLADDSRSTPTVRRRPISAEQAQRVKTSSYWDNGLTNDSAGDYLKRLDAEGFAPQ